MQISSSPPSHTLCSTRRSQALLVDTHLVPGHTLNPYSPCSSLGPSVSELNRHTVPTHRSRHYSLPNPSSHRLIHFISPSCLLSFSTPAPSCTSSCIENPRHCFPAPPAWPPRALSQRCAANEHCPPSLARALTFPPSTFAHDRSFKLFEATHRRAHSLRVPCNNPLIVCHGLAQLPSCPPAPRLDAASALSTPRFSVRSHHLLFSLAENRCRH